MSCTLVKNNFLSRLCFNIFSLDFESVDGPPKSCGFDEKNGEDYFCCSGSTGNPNFKMQPPKWTTASNEPYPCQDSTTHCERWVENYPDSCYPGILRQIQPNLL